MGGLITDPWLLLGPVDRAPSEVEEQVVGLSECLRGAEARLLLPGGGVRGLNETVAAEVDDVPALDLLRLGPPDDEYDRLRVGVECL